MEISGPELPDFGTLTALVLIEALTNCALFCALGQRHVHQGPLRGTFATVRICSDSRHDFVNI